MARWLAVAAFCVALVSCAWAIGGTGAWIFLLVSGAALVPGLPIGVAVFGRNHPAGWIAAAVVGYALTAFALWAPIAAPAPSSIPVVASLAVLSVLAWLLCRRFPSPAVVLPRWTSSASPPLLLVLLLTLAVATPPFAHVGRADEQGNRYYRAYFTADFVWHTALTSEIGKFSMPPRNPYLARQPIHYYWTYYLLPAAVSQVGPAAVRDVQLCLKINALMTGLLLLSAGFLGAWTATGRALASATGAMLGLIASSAEGLYEAVALWRRGAPLVQLRNWNIAAVTAWPPFAGRRIGGLQRCLWYVARRSTAYALGIVSLSIAAGSGAASSLLAIIRCGIALG